MIWSTDTGRSFRRKGLTFYSLLITDKKICKKLGFGQGRLTKA